MSEFKIRDFSRVDSSGFFAQYYKSLLLQTTLKYTTEFKEFANILFRVSPSNKILEIGCGIGHACAHFAAQLGKDGEMHGIDISKNFINYCQKNISPYFKNTCFETADASNLPYANNFFDCCFVNRVLHHLQDVDQAFAEIKRVLKPNGKLAIMEPDFKSAKLTPWKKNVTNTWLDYYSRDVNHPFMGRELSSYFMKNGFKNVSFKATHLDIKNLHFCIQVGVPFYKYFDQAIEDNLLSQEKVNDYLDELKNTSEANPIHYTMELFMVAGTNEK